ncbi:LacI family DNA-binding transcriptional regulator [Pararobbsia silviterrae]|uniref:LacI family transcriptional regulator n=1 Tax=Pararobbsia silviterrae TaxID=1792498 RepID=A0A494X9F8_9BURK|nr:LacI family DNA-binding transcriptional regulator [Pararobbsia silviterrae]RKP45036.1 LacI family transcriptional regulator [Pararobbsia silviterrae]
MTTLTEVARHAGVTPATVSNVLRNRGKVGAATRERVLASVEALGYRPNLTARALAEGRGPTLALMVSSIANPFYPEFALEAERAARKRGHFLLVCNTDDDSNVGSAYLDRIAGTLSQGVLVMNADLHFDDLIKTQRRGASVVLCMWERPDDPPGLSCIAVDFRQAGRLAARHLLELGHRRIGAIVGSAPNGVQAIRYVGLVDALAQVDASLPAKLEQETRFVEDDVEGGYAAAMDLLDASPDLTAIFVSNDFPALGVLHAAADRGLRVPEDLSVIGITDIHWARLSRPALTTVAVPTAQAAEMAVELVLELIHDTPKEPTTWIAGEPQLVVRKSTGPAPSRG